MMKGITKWIIFVIFLAVCVQGVSASFAVNSISVDPQGAMVPGTPVTASFKIDISGQYPADQDLVLYTDLDSPKWTYTILVNGIENVRPATGGRSLDISGFELNYKSTDEVSVRATLEGAAPTVSSTSNQTIFRISEIDANGNTITSSQYSYTAIVVNTGQVTQAISDQENALQTFRSHIDEKAAIGIDTSEAEGKYNEAQQNINSAKTLPTSQYLDALNYLTAAQNAITAGETALDKAWAESEVAAAQVPINNVDSVIAWFNGNQSTASDPQLPAIITKREVAVSYISTANDDIANGNYDQARSKAQDAFSKANESYTDALARQYTLNQNPLAAIFGTLGGIAGSIGVIVIGVIAVVLIVVGIVIYRKRSRWDELG